MGRTDWAPLIVGGGLIVGGVLVFANWKTICPSIMGADKCNSSPTEWFSSPTGSAVGGGRRSINTIGGGGADTVAKNVATGGRASRNSGAAIVGSKASGGFKKPYVGSAIVGGSAAGSNWTPVTKTGRLPAKTTPKSTVKKADCNYCRIYKPGTPNCSHCFTSRYADFNSFMGNFNSFSTITLNRIGLR